MKPTFVGQPVETALLIGTLVVWIAMEIPRALNRRPDARQVDQGSLNFLRLCAVVASVIAALVARIPAGAMPEGPVTFWIGLAIAWAGIGLRWWSFRTLGRYFTFTVQTSADQPVVTSGPYRFVRHPSYTGIMLALAGVATTYGNWLSVAAFVVVQLVVAAVILRRQDPA